MVFEATVVEDTLTEPRSGVSGFARKARLMLKDARYAQDNRWTPAERRRLAFVIDDVRRWIDVSHQLQHLAAHMPLTDQVHLDPRARSIAGTLAEARDSEDLASVAAHLELPWFDRVRSGQAPPREAAARLQAMHRRLCDLDSDEVLADTRSAMAAAAEAERVQLRHVIHELDAWWSQAYDAITGSAHPIIGGGALTDAESSAAWSLISELQEYRAPALPLLDPAHCYTEQCTQAHVAGGTLVEIHDEGLRTGTFDRIRRASDRISTKRGLDREALTVALDSLRDLRTSAVRAVIDVRHLPLTPGASLADAELEAVQAVVDALESNERAAEALLAGAACAEGSCAGMHESAAALYLFYSAAGADGLDRLIESAASRVAAQHEEQSIRLRRAQHELQAWHSESLRLKDGVDHLPLTRSGALSESEAEAVRKTLHVVGAYGHGARDLLDGTACTTGVCEAAHAGALALIDLHAEGTRLGWGRLLSTAVSRIWAQSESEREAVKELHTKARLWFGRAKAIRQSRSDADKFVRSRVTELVHLAPAVTVRQTPVRLLALRENDTRLMRSLELLRDAPLRREDLQLLDEALTASVSLASLAGAFDSQWRCARGASCIAAHDEVAAIHTRFAAIEEGLGRLEAPPGNPPADLDEILDPSLRLSSYLPSHLHSPDMIGHATTERARHGAQAVVDAAEAERRAASSAKKAAEKVRRNDIATALRQMNLEVLKRAASPQTIPVKPLADAGLHSVRDVLQYGYENLQDLPGLGEASAQRIAQAALRLDRGVREETPTRIDVKTRSSQTTALLEALRTWDGARRFVPTQDEVITAEALTRLFHRHAQTTRILALESGLRRPERISIKRLVEDPLDRLQPRQENTDVWHDFLTRPADYYGMLTDLGFITEDVKKMHGDLPGEIIKAVQDYELKRDKLNADLRAYQSFGARFALAQRKVIIGDEMGLGKTVEALAVLAHLEGTGHSHYLIICPAAVVSNWVRETTKHTRLRSFRLHGPRWERDQAAKSWARQGGVAVTTYDLLPWAQDCVAGLDVACAVFDEAHYIKNPRARRSTEAAQIISSVPRAVLMTGTPLENNVEEFRSLVRYVRPDLSESAPDYLPSKFRKHVAPVYLRRNQEDVLTELPELIEVEDWLGMSAADERRYREAVGAGRWMEMRQAAMLSRHSAKTDRLKEIVREAEENGRRVIVFSYFREVLAQIAGQLPGEVFGPLVGSGERRTPPAQRQVLVDRFAEAGHGAVLLATIGAGGVGLNIQSASVVVICEPQVKPTLEDQAIARAHRMGQTSTVQVHRLLTENSVDERMLAILAEKRRCFDEFARNSEIANRAPDALDMNDADVSKVIAEERERLFGHARPPTAQPGPAAS